MRPPTKAFLQTLRARFLVVVAVALVPLLAYTVWRAGAATERRHREAAEEVLSAARQVAAYERELAAGAKALLVALAESPILRENDLARCDRFVRDVAQSTGLYAAIAVSDLQGKVSCASTTDRRPTVADRVYFREAVASEDFAMGEYIVGRSSGRASIHFSYPVREPNGRLRGVVFAALDLDRLQEALEMRGLPPGAEAIITDRRGVVLARMPEGLPRRGERLGDEEFRVALANLGRTHGPAALGGGSERIRGFATPSGPGQGRLFVEVSRPWGDLVAASRQDLMLQVAAIATALLLALVAAYWLGEVFLLRTAEAISRTARRLAGGDYSARTGIAGGGELADAGRALDETAEALERQRDEAAEAATRLREKTQLLASLLDGMEEAIIVVDATRHVVLVNRAARLIHGESESTRSEEWPVRFGLYRRGDPEPMAPETMPSARTLRGEIVRDEEVVMRQPGGAREMPLRVNTRPIFGDGGRIEGALVMLRQETDFSQLDRERRVAIEGRERAEEEMRSLFEANPLPALIYDANSGEVLDANPEAERLYGRPVAALRGIAFTALRAANAGLAAGAPALEAGQRLDWLERHRVNGGHESDLHFVGRGVTYAGRRAVAITANDMAQMLKLERDLRRAHEVLLESQRFAVLGSWEADLPTGRMWLSDAIRDYIGIEGDPSGEQRYGFLRAVSDDAWKNAQRRIHPDDQASYRAARDGALSSGTPLDIEYRVLSPRYGERWIHSKGEVERDAEGRPVRLHGISQDVTERREAEQSVREREASYRLLFRNNPLPMWVYDRNSLDFLDVNDAAVAKYGYSRREFLSMKVTAIRLTVPGEAHPRVEGLGPAVTIARPFVHRLRDGREIVVDSIAHDIEYMGRPARFACPVDVTERIDAEEAVMRANAELESRVAARTLELSGALALQKALFDNAPQMIWTADAHGAITYMSHAWYELTGQQEGDWRRESLDQALHPDDAPRLAVAWQAAIASGAVLATEARYRSKEGPYRDFQVHAAPVRDEQGGVISWVGLATDITERKRAEEALRLSNQELEAFSYSVSHDLRSPLQAIDGFSNAVMTDYADRLDDQGRRYLERIRASAQRMAQLIEDMLQLARVARAAMVPAEVDLSVEARRIVDELAAHDPQRVVSVEIEPGLVAHGDRLLLRQVLANLLGNAWKFTAKVEGAAIRFARDPDPERAVFVVSDNGAGFDMRYAEKLFGVFQRLHTQAEFPGTGVGLATVQRIVLRHGGRIWAESEPGKGASFRFTLEA